MFNRGDRVKIIRAKHGWHDGQTEGIIIHKYVSTGRTTPSFIVRGTDGVNYEINRPNDIRSI